MIIATKILTNTSDFGIFVINLKKPHLKVEIATIIITPTSAAIGIFSITGAPIRIIIKIVIAPIAGPNLERDPASKLTNV